MKTLNIKTLSQEYLELDMEQKQKFLGVILQEMEISYILKDINDALKSIGKSWFCFDVIDRRKQLMVSNEVFFEMMSMNKKENIHAPFYAEVKEFKNTDKFHSFIKKRVFGNSN